MTTTWHEQKSFTFIHADHLGQAWPAEDGEDERFREALKSQGWESDPIFPDGSGYVNVRRPFKLVVKVSDGEPQSQIQQLGDTVEKQRERLIQLERVCATQQKAIEELETRAQHQTDEIVITPRFREQSAEPPHPQGVDKTEPLAAIVDYEAAGAPWTLTIEGGRRR